MADRVVVRVGMGTKISIVVGGIFTFGMWPLIVWLTQRGHSPKVLDREGLTLRNGKRLLWRDLTGIVRTTISGGFIVVKPLDLMFGKRVVRIIPRTIANRDEVFAFLSQVLGQRL